MTNSTDLDKLEVSADGKGLKVKSEGSGANRLTTAFTDLVSPVTEGAGAIGDVIRLYRQNNVIRALEHAHNIARKHRVTLKPIPPKFLVDWAEKASLEEEGEDDLSELWGGLLVSEVLESHPSNLLFKRILGELSGEHKKFLNWLIEAETMKLSSNSFETIAKNWNTFFEQKKIAKT